MTPKRPWTVAPHSSIEKLDDNLWTVDSAVPGLNGVTRRMCIIKRSDGTLVFSHAIPLSDEALAEVTAWGKPAYLIIGHDQHCLDAEAFRAKLGLRAYCPKECEAKVRARVEVAGTFDTFPADAAVAIESAPGVKHGEPVVMVKSGGGERLSLVFADVIQNTPPETLPFMLRLLGFGGGPKVVFVFRRMFIKDKPALKTALERWAGLPQLTRLIPCHGAIVGANAAAALRAAADAL